jgi:hypothetical protein
MMTRWSLGRILSFLGSSGILLLIALGYLRYGTLIGIVPLLLCDLLGLDVDAQIVSVGVGVGVCPTAPAISVSLVPISEHSLTIAGHIS